LHGLVVVISSGASAAFGCTMRSLRSQSHRDFSAIVVVPALNEQTRAAYDATIASDERLFLHERGSPIEAALRDALDRADFVSFLAEFDVWFPDHLTQLQELLERNDFAHTLAIRYTQDSTMLANACDVEQAGFMHLLQSSAHLPTALSSWGYRLRKWDTQRGAWLPPFDELACRDQIAQFARETISRGASGLSPTVVSFDAESRQGWSTENRAAEIEHWFDYEGNPAELPSFRFEMLKAALGAQRSETRMVAKELASQTVPVAPLAPRAPAAPTQPLASGFSSLNPYRQRS
jgi:hypothetical protein